MKQVQISSFSMFDYKGIEDNLTAMAAKDGESNALERFCGNLKEKPSNKNLLWFFQGRVSEFESIRRSQKC